MNYAQKKLPATSALIAFFSIITLLSSLALMVEYDLDRLVKESTDIVIGKVVKTDSHWNKNKTAIVTDVTITIEQALKGKAQKSLTVQYLGGAIAKSDGTGVGLGISDTPSFKPNEEVLLFVQQEKDRGSFKVTADFQGKLSIIKDEKTGIKMIKGAPKTLADPKTLKVRKVKEFQAPLDDMVAKVKEIVQKQTKDPSK